MVFSHSLHPLVPIFYEVVDAVSCHSIRHTSATLIPRLQLRATLEKQTEKGPLEIDLLHWMGRTATELIGRSGLGYSFDSLAQGAPEHPYATSVKEYMYVLSLMPCIRWSWPAR